MAMLDSPAVRRVLVFCFVAAAVVFLIGARYHVEPQPAAGSCHARGHGLYTLPDPHCTPGATDPRVTPATLRTTICRSGYTKTVRPPESVTEPEKLASMRAYGDPGTAHRYEYDHLISLELGGAPNDAKNLWPEPGASPNPKDKVENLLHREVCRGQIGLRTAQHEIAGDWVKLYRANFGPRGSAGTSRVPRPTGETEG